MDITNLGKRLETVLTHVEDEDFIDIRDEEKLYNKTTKKSVAITFSFDYPQQKNLFKDFKEFGK